MNQNLPNPVDGQRLNFMLASGDMQRRVKNGASNFFWIAGLSIGNSIVYLLGERLTFVVGLGITQVVDILALDLAHLIPNSATLIRAFGLSIDLFISGVFVLFGYFAGRGYRWAFIAGMILYGLDAVLMAVAKDIIGFGFHLFFLWLLFSGYQTLNKLIKMIPQTSSDTTFPKNIGG